MRSLLTLLVFSLILVFGSTNVLVGAQGTSAKRMALIIGNSGYSKIPPLRNPGNDAELMAKTLAELGFEVTVEIDADRRKMARSILDFGRRLSAAGDDAVGLFFYAGHGVQADGANFLLPIGAEVDTEADLEIEAVNANWIMSQMDEAGNAMNVVILDACRNNPFETTFRSATRGLARLDAPAGSLVAYSAAPGQTAVDGDGNNSPYTAALANAMRQPGTELLQVFRQVRLEVEAATGGEQTPWEEQSLRSDFFFVDPPADAEAEVATGTPEQGTNSSGTHHSLELALWNSVKDSGDAELLRAYVEQYPNGTFAGLARVMIERLDGAETFAGAAPSGETALGETEVASLPETGLPSADGEAADDTERHDAQPPDDTEPVVSEREIVRRIQTALKAVGCNPGVVDGVWGRQTERAARRFFRQSGAERPGQRISLETARIIESRDGRVCALVCGPRREERNGRCVLKTCPPGQYLNSRGKCRERQQNQAAQPQQQAPSSQPSTTAPSCGGASCCCAIGSTTRCVGRGACINTYLGHCTMSGNC